MSAPANGTCASAASTVGTADSVVTRYFSTSFQKLAMTSRLRYRPMVGMIAMAFTGLGAGLVVNHNSTGYIPLAIGLDAVAAWMDRHVPEDVRR